MKSFDEWVARQVDKADDGTVTRKPLFWCTYTGDVTNGVREPAGPNTMGELLWPVVASYDPESGKTRVGWSLIPPKMPAGVS